MVEGLDQMIFKVLILKSVRKAEFPTWGLSGSHDTVPNTAALNNCILEEPTSNKVAGKRE